MRNCLPIPAPPSAFELLCSSFAAPCAPFRADCPTSPAPHATPAVMASPSTNVHPSSPHGRMLVHGRFMHSFVELIALLDLTGLALTVARFHATLAPQLTPQLLHSCFAAPCALASSRLLRSLIVAPPSAPQQPFARHSPILPCLELTVQITRITGFSSPSSTVSSHPRLPIHRRPMQPCLEPSVPILHVPRADHLDLRSCPPSHADPVL